MKVKLLNNGGYGDNEAVVGKIFEAVDDAPTRTYDILIKDLVAQGFVADGSEQQGVLCWCYYEVEVVDA